MPALERLAVRQISAAVPVAGRADRDRRSAAGGPEHPADRWPSWAGRRRRSRASCAATRPGSGVTGRSRRTGGRPRAGPARHRRRIETNGELRQLVGELLAQRWSPQQISRHLRLQVPRRAGDVAVPREHLPGRLPARIAAAAPVAAGSAPSVAAAHRTRSPPRASARRAAPAPVRAAHAHDPRAAVPARGPLPGRALGRRSHHRQGPGLGDRHPGRAADPDGPAAAPAASATATPCTTR